MLNFWPFQFLNKLVFQQHFYLFTYFELLSITLTESILGALFGYGLLWGINKVVLFLRGRQGIGEGDMELMALVGSFWGL